MQKTIFYAYLRPDPPCSPLVADTEQLGDIDDSSAGITPVFGPTWCNGFLDGARLYRAA